MSQTHSTAAELQTDTQDTVVEVSHQSAVCYFQPETEQLVFLTGKEAADFENHSRDMARRADEFNRSQATYSAMLDHYARAAAKGAIPPAEKDVLVKQVSAAEVELEEKRKAVRDALGEFSQANMNYDGVMELLPLAKGANNKPRFSYVRKGYFRNAQEGRRLSQVRLTGRDKRPGSESIYVTDSNGNRRIDAQKLKQQLSSLDTPALSLELKDVLGWAGMEDVLEDLQKDVALFDWAESWNENLVGATELGENVDLSGGAQVMRYVQNVGMSAEYDPGSGSVAIKAEAKSSLTLASGMTQMTVYVPDRMGWSLNYTTDDGNAFDMGLLRLVLTPSLSGFIGASVVLEGQLQVVTQGEQQLLAGQPGSRLPRFSERRDRGAVFYRQMEAQDEGLTLTGQAFAGATAEVGLKGALQWLKPTPPPDINASAQETPKSSGEYVDFCSVAANIGAMAGIGLGGKFYCTFINGKFCFHVAASLCWGAGAKGGLVFEVGTKDILEFGGWLSYQLYRLNYRFFDLISKESFESYTHWCVVQMVDLKKDVYKKYNNLKANISDVAEEFRKFIRSILAAPGKGVDESKARNELARNVVEGRARLLIYTPEAKGILLYLLTRHGKWDDLDYENYNAHLDRHHHRKEAVVCILWSIQTCAEWEKVMCRVSADGKPRNELEDISSVVCEQEADLIRFLQIGFNRDDDLHKRKKEFESIRGCLKKAPALGYSLSMNNTAYYQINDCDNPSFLSSSFVACQWT